MSLLFFRTVVSTRKALSRWIFVRRMSTRSAWKIRVRASRWKARRGAARLGFLLGESVFPEVKAHQGRNVVGLPVLAEAQRWNRNNWTLKTARSSHEFYSQRTDVPQRDLCIFLQRSIVTGVLSIYFQPETIGEFLLVCGKSTKFEETGKILVKSSKGERRIIVYGSVTRYGPQSAASAQAVKWIASQTSRADSKAPADETFFTLLSLPPCYNNDHPCFVTLGENKTKKKKKRMSATTIRVSGRRVATRRG